MEKKILALFIQYHYKRKVYCERTVQVECLVISLLSKNAMLCQTLPSTDEIYQ